MGSALKGSIVASREPAASLLLLYESREEVAWN